MKQITGKEVKAPITDRKKSKIALYWEAMEKKKPLYEYIDMRAVLK